jgi:hypothetical protein
MTKSVKSLVPNDITVHNIFHKNRAGRFATTLKQTYSDLVKLVVAWLTQKIYGTVARSKLRKEIYDPLLEVAQLLPIFLDYPICK